MSVKDRIKNLERRSSLTPEPRASESAISQAELDEIRGMRRQTESEEVRRASMPARPDWLKFPEEEKSSSGPSVASMAAKLKGVPMFGVGMPPRPKLAKVDETSASEQEDEGAASTSSGVKPSAVRAFPVHKLAQPIPTAGAEGGVPQKAKPAPSAHVTPPPTGNEDRATVPSGLKRQPSYKNLKGKTDVQSKIKHLGAVLPAFGQPMPPKRRSMIEVSSSDMARPAPAARFSESAVTSETRLSESDARLTRAAVSHTRRAPRKKRPIGNLTPVAAAITPIEAIETAAVSEDATKEEAQQAPKLEEKVVPKPESPAKSPSKSPAKSAVKSATKLESTTETTPTKESTEGAQSEAEKEEAAQTAEESEERKTEEGREAVTDRPEEEVSLEPAASNPETDVVEAAADAVTEKAEATTLAEPSADSDA